MTFPTVKQLKKEIKGIKFKILNLSNIVFFSNQEVKKILVFVIYCIFSCFSATLNAFLNYL